ncbi:PASTA domain-containing protein [Candidatus Latescibacterota bacterium]
MDSEMQKGNSVSNDKKKSGKQSLKKKITYTLLKHMFLAGCAFSFTGLLILLILDQIVFPIALKAGKEVNAPNLVGKNLEEAEELILKENFKLLPDSTEYNNDYPANTISFQYPYAYTKIKPNRRIRVTVSLGSKPLLMPDLTGKPKRDAELLIDEMGLKLASQEWVHSNDYLKGIVARQYPEGNQDVSENIDIVLYISDGLPETDVIMPNLIELGRPAALDTLKAYGFDISEVTIQTEEALELLPESVIDQHPDPGTPTSSKNAVILVVSPAK